MVNPYPPTTQLLAAALLAFIGGCASLADMPALVAMHSGGDSHDLPPRDAARACRATAEELDRNGEYSPAISLYERARTLDPKLRGIAARLAVLYARQGDPVRARSEFQTAIAEAPDDCNVLNDFAYFHYEQGEWPQAEQLLHRVLRLNPDDNRAGTNLGLVLGAQGRYDESLAAFERASGSAAAQHNLALVLARGGQLEDARSAARSALAKEPGMKVSAALLSHLDSLAKTR